MLLINYFHPKTNPTCGMVNCSTGAGFFFMSFGTPKRNPDCSVLSFFHRVRGFYSCEAAVQCTLCHNNFIGLFEANRNSLLSTLFRSWAKHGLSPVCVRVILDTLLSIYPIYPSPLKLNAPKKEHQHE